MTIAPGQPESTGTDIAVALDIQAVDGAVAIQGRSPWQIVRRRLRRDRVTMVALFTSIFFILLAATSPLLAALGIISPDLTHPELVQGLGSMPEGALGGVSPQHLSLIHISEPTRPY